MGVLLNTLGVQGQNVMWFTDEDSIAANDDRVRELTQLFAWISSLHLAFNLGEFKCGTSRCDDGSRQIEDLLSIPDMIAGALSEQMAINAEDNIFWMHRPDFSDKTKTLTWWFSDSSSSLKRILFVANPDKLGKGNLISTFHFYDQK